MNYIKFIWITRRNSRLDQVKVRRANLQTISSYYVRFCTVILFSSLVSFAIFLCTCFLFCLFVVFLKLRIFVLIHIRLCGRVTFRKQDYFFWQMFEVFAKLVNGFYRLNNFAKWSIKNVWPGPKFDFGPLVVNPLSANPTKGSTHSKNFVGKRCLTTFRGWFSA